MNPNTPYWGTVTAIGTDVNKNGTPFLVIDNLLTHVWDGQATIQLDAPQYASIRMCLKDGKAYEISEEKLLKMGFNCDFENPKLADAFYAGVWMQYEEKEVDGRKFNECPIRTTKPSGSASRWTTWR